MNREIIEKLIEDISKISGLHIEDDNLLAETIGFLKGLLTPTTTK